MRLPVGICIWMQVSPETSCIGSSGTGVIDSCELPDMVAGYWTQVHWKNWLSILNQLAVFFFKPLC